MTKYILPRLRRVSDHTFVENLIDGDWAAVVDLGMNKGAFAREIKRRKPRVKLFGCEPVPDLHANLFAEFGAGALKVAVGAKTETTHITVYDHYCPSIVFGALEASGAKVPVHMQSLDEFVSSLDIEHINLVKVDIEGSELGMLLNASPSTLSKCDQITVEFHEFLDARQLPDILACIARLEAIGFVTFRCSISNYSDVLFVHRDHIRGAIGKALMWLAVMINAVTLEKASNFGRRLIENRRGFLSRRPRPI